jgi:protease-4
MSTLAASGGYYIAMACDTIVAQPNTITGSIGVFGILFNVETLINDKLGVYSDGVKTGTFSDLGNPARPLTPFERAIVQKEVEEIYEDFTTKAANNRRMVLDSLQKVAEGRVWAGSDAKNIGLVDVLGGTETAIEIASAAAGLGDDYKVRYYPAQKPFFEKIFESMSAEVRTRMLKQELGPLYNSYRNAKKALLWQGYQARLPIQVEFH